MSAKRLNGIQNLESRNLMAADLGGFDMAMEVVEPAIDATIPAVVAEGPGTSSLTGDGRGSVNGVFMRDPDIVGEVQEAPPQAAGTDIASAVDVELATSDPVLILSADATSKIGDPNVDLMLSGTPEQIGEEITYTFEFDISDSHGAIDQAFAAESLDKVMGGNDNESDDRVVETWPLNYGDGTTLPDGPTCSEEQGPQCG